MNIHYSARKICFGIIVSILIGWSIFVFGLFLFLKYQKGFDSVQILHVAGLPYTYGTLRREKGESSIRQGKALYEKGLFSEGFEHIRAGLREVPDDLVARQTLVDTYLALGRNDIVADLLRDGFLFHYGNSAYVRNAFETLLRIQRDDLVIAITNKFLSPETLSVDTWDTYVLAVAAADYLRGDLREAEGWLGKIKDVKRKDFCLLLARIKTDLGKTDDALAVFSRLRDLYPNDNQVYSEYHDSLIKFKGYDTARQIALIQSIKFPEAWEPRLDLISSASQTKDATETRSLVYAYIDKFSQNRDAVAALAALLADLGAADLSLILMERVRDRRGPWTETVVGLVEAQVADGRYLDASTTIRQYKSNFEDNHKNIGVIASLDLLNSIAEYAKGDRDEALKGLQFYSNSPSVRPDLLVLAAIRFEKIGAIDFAKIALHKALVLDPKNQKGLLHLIELDLIDGTADDLPLLGARLLSLRQPPKKILSETLSLIERDIYLFLPDRNKFIVDLNQALSRQRIYP